MSYWNSDGELQGEYDRLSELIPATGSCFETDMPANKASKLELLRCLGNVYYDVYNNGGCNLGSSRLEDVIFLIKNKDTIVESMQKPSNFDVLNIYLENGKYYLPECHYDELEDIATAVIEIVALAYPR